eukprot:TRINITY_DN39556_c0_g1_i1.p1 TRINITY_DN39556_c0_g1~~TRINITY_DN39556_c0_g1_i1.p1  ORF type:complete len:492 (-),score=64.32 TRINITY_DN39556_c0_g1_i1:157-1605(-)
MAHHGQLVVGIIDETTRSALRLSEAEAAQLQSIAESTLRRCERNERSLRALELSNTVFTTLFLSELSVALQHNTRLQEVYLDRCKLGDDGARLLTAGLAQRESHDLRLLSLEENEIGCRGAVHVAKVFSSGSSRFARTFGGYCTPSFGPGRGLRQCSLKGNSIAAVGCRAICEALTCSNDSLEELIMQGNQIGSWAAGWFSLVLRNNNVIKVLDLRANPIGRDGLEELKSACKAASATMFMELRESPVVVGQRLVSILVSQMVAQETATCAVANGGEPAERPARPGSAPVPRSRLEASRGPSEPSGAFRRPGSASSRRPMAISRQNTMLGIEEPGAVHANSAGLDDNTARLGGQVFCRSPQRVAADVGGGAAPRRLGGRKAPGPAVSTYTIAARNAAANRRRPGERAVATDEKETTTVLTAPSRWLWKPGQMPASRITRPASACHSSGTSLQRPRMQRPSSAPSLRRGMLMGPVAASAVMCM